MFRKIFVFISLLSFIHSSEKFCAALQKNLRPTADPPSPKAFACTQGLPFGRLWYGRPNAAANAIGYAKHYSRAHHAVIRVYDDAGNVIETHQHKGDFKEW